MKKHVISIILISALLFCAVTITWTNKNDPANASQLKERVSLARELQELDGRTGGHSEVSEGVDLTGVLLKFASVAEFEEALKTLEIVSEDEGGSPEPVNNTGIDKPGNGDLPADTAYFQKKLTTANAVFIMGIKLGSVNNEIVAEYYFEPSGSKRFHSVTAQNSHSHNQTGFTWTQNDENHTIIDAQRTLTSTLNGSINLTVDIQGITVRYTIGHEIYNEYYYTQL